MRLVFVLSWLSHRCRCVHCSMLVQCDVVYLQVPIHYAKFQLEVDLFLKVTSAEATAVDVIDGGGTRISRLFHAQVIRQGSGPNRVVECPFWAVLQAKAGVQPWVVSVVPFGQVRPPSTHNRLLLWSIDALGQLQRWKQYEWSDVRAIAPAPHLKEAVQAFLHRFQKQLLGKGTKGEKGGNAGSNKSRDPSLQSKGRAEQQARSSSAPSPHDQPPGGSTGGGGGRGEGGGVPFVNGR